MIILDTHTLIWWVDKPDRLSKKIRKTIDKAKKEENILVSSISIFEIFLLIKKGKLELATSPDIWLEKIESLPFVKFIPVDNNVAAFSVNLSDFPHKDPADRMIVATALLNNATLITSDQEILKYSKVRAIW